MHRAHGRVLNGSDSSARGILAYRLSALHHRLLAEALPTHRVQALAVPVARGNAECSECVELLAAGCPGNADRRDAATVAELLRAPGDWFRVLFFDATTSCPIALAELASRCLVSVVPTADHRFAIQELRRLVSERSAGLTADRILEDARLSWPPELEVLGRRALRLSAEPLSVSALATAARMPERTLRSWLARRSRLTPQRLIGWCRLLHVGDALDASDRTVDAIASALRFRSPAALRAQLRLYTGLTPTALRRAGALASIARAFREALEDCPGDGAHHSQDYLRAV